MHPHEALSAQGMAESRGSTSMPIEERLLVMAGIPAPLSRSPSQWFLGEWASVQSDVMTWHVFARLGVWIGLICIAGLLLVWVWRRWRMRNRGLATAGLMTLACTLLTCGGAVGLASAPQWSGGNVGWLKWTHPYESDYGPDRPRDNSDYNLSREKEAINRWTEGDARHAVLEVARSIQVQAFACSRKGEPGGAVVCFRLRAPVEDVCAGCRALGVVLRVNGRAVRDEQGQLIQADLSAKGPVQAIGADDDALAVNMSSAALVRAAGTSWRAGGMLQLEWALVLVGPGDIDFRMEQQRVSVVLRGPVEVGK